MKIILGLGNPGRDYTRTRHNVGYRVIELLAERLGLDFNKAKFNSLLAEGQVGSEKLILAKPTTYMNRSGLAAQDIISFYKVDPRELLVVYDDIDLEVGSLRIRKKGSAGTHNGMRDIISRLASDDFPRIRLGIGKDPRIPLASFVLSGFTKEEEVLIDEAIKEGVDALELYLSHGLEAAMNKYNRRR